MTPDRSWPPSITAGRGPAELRKHAKGAAPDNGAAPYRVIPSYVIDTQSRAEVIVEPSVNMAFAW